ncbi:universal stress protein [Zafaria cholistanensis]|uniref:Universal stress protein n=1 Tax=Zafaria cholistanensis TaxID=1682741 RepID=A0A5A7NVH6_9MICC|nr:universal stress protein [Zafaria cholistanensis]GER24118.1 universal stress protein [Zafaria cholistanensis]
MGEERAGIPAAERISGIVVGVDGSEQAERALRWAEEEAARRGVPLNIATAYTIPVFAASSMDAGYATLDDEAIREGAEEVAREASESVRVPGLEVRTLVEPGDAAGVLLDLSAQADLVVVGSRGRGGFVGRLLGSVSSALPAHAKCPTVIVPLPPDEGEALPRRDVVTVGVDGSERARRAVLVAAEQAQRLGVPLRVVCSVPPVSGSLAWMPATVDQEEVLADVRHQVDNGLRWLSSHFPALRLESEVMEGSPVEALIRESATSLLLVTGSRGRGGFTGMLLGSTSQGVLHHAKGPVMVVPDGEDPRLADRSRFDDAG